MEFDINQIIDAIPSLGSIRRYLILLVLLGSTIQYLRVRRARKRITPEEEEVAIQQTYKKDENGFYPWEVDTDDHPNSIPKDSKRVANTWGPKRGKW